MPVDDDVATLLRLRRSELPEGTRSVRLRVVGGPDRDQTFFLDVTSAGRMLVGTSAACEIRLTDRRVSRRHLAVDLSNGRVRVTDLGSTNGSFVDGSQVVEGYAGVGQTIGLGDTNLRVEADEDAESKTPPASPPRPGADGFGSIIGSSPALQRIFPLCRKLAQSDVPVIIEGETGTGKEVLAESIHEQGKRAAAPFVVFDCTAVPPNLIEGELFGHERGAYTGAVTTRKGVFEQAHGGTLLIDEIGDLELSLQPKLLRAIERSQIRRLGGAESIAVDVRILAATRRDLDKEVAAGRFRDDLFHRLAVTRIELPPLRRRKGDIEALARHFFTGLGDPAALSSTLIARWQDYDWPGNVRELRNACARHVALGELAEQGEMPEAEPEETVHGDDVIERVLAMKLPLTLARDRVVDNFERRYVARVLAEHGGNVARAAKASGIERRYLQKLKARQSE